MFGRVIVLKQHEVSACLVSSRRARCRSNIMLESFANPSAWLQNACTRRWRRWMFVGVCKENESAVARESSNCRARESTGLLFLESEGEGLAPSTSRNSVGC